MLADTLNDLKWYFFPEAIENRLAEWRRLLRSSTTQGRTASSESCAAA
jgi:hypothetical protein